MRISDWSSDVCSSDLRRTVPGVTIAGALAALLSALALYAGSGNCRWRLPAALCRHGNVTGLVLALVSLAAWIAALGVGAGLCAMLGCWVLAMEIGRAHVCTPVTNAQLVCRLLLEKTKEHTYELQSRIGRPYAVFSLKRTTS